jgi:hypothetical protein
VITKSTLERMESHGGNHPRRSVLTKANVKA